MCAALIFEGIELTQTDDLELDQIEHAIENDRATRTVHGDCARMQSEVDRLTTAITGLREQRSKSGDVEARLLELELQGVQESLKIAQRAKARL